MWGAHARLDEESPGSWIDEGLESGEDHNALIRPAQEAVPTPQLELDVLLDRGVAARTYSGRWQDQAVWVQVVSSVFLRAPQLLDAVRVWAEAIVGLEHPHLLTPLSIGTSAGRPAIIYPQPAGRSLRDALDEGPLTPAQGVAL